MAFSDITLTSGMRGSLLNIQGTSRLIDRTRERLSTGKQVNSALDNPTNFFAAQAATNRASDLNGRKDGITETVQNIRAATGGVTAISSLLQAATGIASAALDTSDQTSRDLLAKQFDEVLNQIDNIRDDSGYRGTNLLNSQSLTINLAEQSGQSTLSITGVDASSTGLGVERTNPTGVAPSDVSQNISAGTGYCLAINSDGTVKAWGSDASAVPAGLTDVVSVKSGNNFSLALKSDGSVVAWGSDAPSGMPAGLTGVIAISAGYNFAVALKSDGTVVAWGDNSEGQSTVPGGLTGVVAIAAGTGTDSRGWNSLALKSDGTVVAWGSNDFGMVSDAATLTGITAISNGGFNASAIKSDGTVVSFGSDNAFGQENVPAGLTDVTAISAGPDFTLALKKDGTVVAWGGNLSAQQIPAGLTGVVAISAGPDYGLALKSDGNVLGWGINVNGVTVPQAGLRAGNPWSTTSGIQTSLDELKTATDTIRSIAQNLSSNSNILTIRLDFSDSMIAILQAGADNLTLADINQEGANMLMLQTRQDLGTTSLSMGVQAAQSLMRLF